jgi:hypothetical protein
VECFLVVCSNVANLQLGRTATRTRVRHQAERSAPVPGVWRDGSHREPLPLVRGAEPWASCSRWPGAPRSSASLRTSSRVCRAARRWDRAALRRGGDLVTPSLAAALAAEARARSANGETTSGAGRSLRGRSSRPRRRFRWCWWWARPPGRGLARLSGPARLRDG